MDWTCHSIENDDKLLHEVMLEVATSMGDLVGLLLHWMDGWLDLDKKDGYHQELKDCGEVRWKALMTSRKGECMN